MGTKQITGAEATEIAQGIASAERHAFDPFRIESPADLRDAARAEYIFLLRALSEAVDGHLEPERLRLLRDWLKNRALAHEAWMADYRARHSLQKAS